MKYILNLTKYYRQILYPLFLRLNYLSFVVNSLNLHANDLLRMNLNWLH
jgi:hypothetical protein